MILCWIGSLLEILSDDGNHFFNYVLSSSRTGRYCFVSPNMSPEPRHRDSHLCRGGWRHGGGLLGRYSAFHRE